MVLTKAKTTDLKDFIKNNCDVTHMAASPISFLLTERLKKGIFCIRVIHDRNPGGQLVG
jgi:hypothetical protein